MDTPTILGLVAGAITSFSFLPQVIKTIKTKSTHDVSIEMFGILSFGILLWIIYGFFVRSLPVVLANSVSFVLVFTMVILKLKYK
ncbi:MAG: SemiSWEET transporter [Elusimicrobia bacterium]|nr:SemiSWEET transporter [Elusimicrobiota bacterium]